MLKTPPIRSKYINTVPILLSSVVAAWGIYAYTQPHYFAPLMLGIIAGGLVDLDNGLTGKLKNLLFTLVAFTISSLAIQLTFNQPLLLTVTFTALAFIFTLLGAAGMRYRTIAFGTLAVSVYTALTHNPHMPLYLNSLLILSGTILYSGMALLVHIVFPHRAVQENMAAAYDALAQYLNTKADFFDPDEAEFFDNQQVRFAMANSSVINAFNQCRSALFYRMRGQHRHPRTAKMLRCYFIAQDIHERINSSHVHYQDFTAQMRHTDLIYRIRRLLQLQAQACSQFAAALRNNQAYQSSGKLERATANTLASLQHYAEHRPENTGIAPYRIQRLLDNIGHVSMLFSHLAAEEDSEWTQDTAKTRIQAPESSGFKNAWKVLKAQNTRQSPVFRHAVRMAVTVLICCLLIQFVAVIHWQEQDLSLGFWILLTAIFVCQPNYSATQKRVVQRMAGTIAGVLVGSALPLFAFSFADKLAIGALSTTLFFYFRINKHSYATFFITLQALTGFSIMGYDLTAFFIPRIIDTLVGAAVAGAAVYLLWPDWKYLSIDKTAQAAIQSNAGYLKAVLDEYAHGLSNDLNYRIARRHSHDKAAALSSTVSDMSGEPEKHAHRLQDAFYLLKANYSLLSYIAALGAYRDKLDHQDEQFLADFYLAGGELAGLLEQIGRPDADGFEAQWQSLHNRLEHLRQYTGSDCSRQNSMLWQQLNMMSSLMLPCYQALHRPNGETTEQPESLQAA